MFRQDSESQSEDCRNERPSKAVVIGELSKFIAKVHRLIVVGISVYALGPHCTAAIGIGLMLVALSKSPEGSRQLNLDHSPDRT